MSCVPGANPLISARVWLIAAPVRYMVTPSQLTRAGRDGSNPARARRPDSESRSKSTATKLTVSGTVIPADARCARFHRWVPGWSTSKTRTGPSGRVRGGRAGR